MVIHLSSERGTRTKEAADGQRGLYQTPVIEEGEKWELVEVCLWLFYKPLGGASRKDIPTTWLLFGSE